MSDGGLDERAKRAFSAAAGHLPDVEIDPAAIRHRHRARRAATVLVAAAVALAVGGGAIALSQLGPPVAEVAGPNLSARPNPPLPSDPPLRTIYYRDIGFDVPADWAFGDESPWCGEQTPESDGYVQLGEPPPLPRPACPPGKQPKAPPVDHVVVTPAEGAVAAATTSAGGWWTSIRRVGDVQIRAVARERATALELVESASVRQSSCAPHSTLEGDPNARPAVQFDLDRVDRVDTVTLCQYDVTGATATTGLRGVARLEGEAATRALKAFQSAPRDQRSCAAGPLDAAIVVQLATVARIGELYVRVGSCEGAEDFGVDTVDDGTTQRRLTSDSCAALQAEPVSVRLLTGDAAAVC